jgi:hypothetical protein
MHQHPAGRLGLRSNRRQSLWLNGYPMYCLRGSILVRINDRRVVLSAAIGRPRAAAPAATVPGAARLTGLGMSLFFTDLDRERITAERSKNWAARRSTRMSSSSKTLRSATTRWSVKWTKALGTSSTA